MAYSPDTAAPMGVLAEILLRSNEGLTRAERELIGMYVSYLNDCFYCHHSHGEIACIYLGGDLADVVLLEQVGEHARATLPRIALPPEWHKDHVGEQGRLVRTHGRLNSANVGSRRTLTERPVQPDFLPIW